jgi:hypothetical protein
MIFLLELQIKLLLKHNKAQRVLGGYKIQQEREKTQAPKTQGLRTKPMSLTSTKQTGPKKHNKQTQTEAANQKQNQQNIAGHQKQKKQQQPIHF